VPKRTFVEEVLLQRGLPRPLRIYWFVPATVLFISITGLALALPPGPLCDEGMILFMEGGCDMGESNIFFFSKLGAIVAVNVALVVAWKSASIRVAALIPHLLLLAGLGWRHRSGGRCDTYYSHPNGSIGQMALEVLAFAVLGIAVLYLVRGRRSPILLSAILGWNFVHIVPFYSWLKVTDHWTWQHTWLLCGSMLFLSGLAVTANTSLQRTRFGARGSLRSAPSVARR
jgi:hypothetical protein